MADYLVTDTELTSLANAIRTKTGDNSSLTFPSGFVSAIQGISTGTESTFDGFGLNPEYVSTILDDSILLKDTDYATWTPSTTASIILPLSNLSTSTLATTEYDYTVFTDVTINYVYKSGTTVVNGPLEYYYTCITSPIRRASTRTEFNNDTRAQSSYDYAEWRVLLYAYPGGSTYISYSNNGIYASGATPLVSNGSTSTPSYTWRSPVIRAVCNSTTMTEAMAAAIDQNQTAIKRKMTLYRYTKDSTRNNNIYQRLNNLYTAEHSNS